MWIIIMIDSYIWWSPMIDKQYNPHQWCRNDFSFSSAVAALLSTMHSKYKNVNLGVPFCSAVSAVTYHSSNSLVNVLNLYWILNMFNKICKLQKTLKCNDAVWVYVTLEAAKLFSITYDLYRILFLLISLILIQLPSGVDTKSESWTYADTPLSGG